MKGKTKKVVNFLVLRPEFTKNNMSAIGIVVVLVCAYSVFGGHVTSGLPKIKSGSTFGSVHEEDFQQEGLMGLGENGEDVPPAPEPVRNGADRAEAQSVIGQLPSDAEAARMREIDKRGRLFD